MATKPPPKIQKESIWRTLPRACFGLIAAVVLDVVAMLGYATLLLMDGASPSAFYFAAVVLTGAFILVFFTMSAVLSENTIELLATVCVGTCVTIMVFWLRLGGGNLDQVQRTTERGGMMDDLFPDPAQKQFVLTLGALATQGTIQLAFVVFGYLSYKDFGWRIFKLFGTDLGMRQVYETYLWFKALLKMDALLAGLNVAAGFAFFYFKEGESWRVVMIVGVGSPEASRNSTRSSFATPPFPSLRSAQAIGQYRCAIATAASSRSLLSSATSDRRTPTCRPSSRRNSTATTIRRSERRRPRGVVRPSRRSLRASAPRRPSRPPRSRSEPKRRRPR